MDIISFRSIAVHEYFAIRWHIAWVAASEEVPVLKEQIEKILQEEFRIEEIIKLNDWPPGQMTC